MQWVSKTQLITIIQNSFMSLFHYFSKNPDKRARFIFNFIAPLYGRLGNSLEQNFVYSFQEVEKNIQITDTNILDLGTGTGAWIANFKRAGANQVIGVDFARNMIDEAKKNYPDIEFQIGDAENLHQFPDQSFDIVTASFVLHGVKKNKRQNILNEMKRVSKNYVVVHDFIGKTPLFIRLLEFLEQSDYKFFKQNFCNELKSIFPNAKKIPTKYGTGVYIASKY